MSSAPEISTLLFPTLAPFPSASPAESSGGGGGGLALEPNTTSCQEWEEAHHLLFHLGNLSLLVGLIIPTTVALHMILLRLLLMTGQCTAPPADCIPVPVLRIKAQLIEAVGYWGMLNLPQPLDVCLWPLISSERVSILNESSTPTVCCVKLVVKLGEEGA